MIVEIRAMCFDYAGTVGEILGYVKVDSDAIQIKIVANSHGKTTSETPTKDFYEAVKKQLDLTYNPAMHAYKILSQAERTKTFRSIVKTINKNIKLLKQIQ